MRSKTLVLGQLPPTKIAPRITNPRTIAPEENYPPPPVKLPQGKLPPTIKFFPKIIARTQVNFPKRVLRVN